MLSLVLRKRVQLPTDTSISTISPRIISSSNCVALFALASIRWRVVVGDSVDRRVYVNIYIDFIPQLHHPNIYLHCCYCYYQSSQNYCPYTPESRQSSLCPSSPDNCSY